MSFLFCYVVVSGNYPNHSLNSSVNDLMTKFEMEIEQ